MKKAILTITSTLLFCSALWAQTDKGRWQIGAQIGNFKYQNEGQYAVKAFAGSITPTVGYFLANNLLVGTGIPVSYSTAYLNYPSVYLKTYQLSYGLSPFINYYFGKGNWKPFVGVAYGFNQSVSYYKSSFQDESKTKGHSTVIAPHVGVAYFVSRSIALNLGLNFNIQHQIPLNADIIPVSQAGFVDHDDAKYFSLDIGFQLYFGK